MADRSSLEMEESDRQTECQIHRRDNNEHT
jgi:hypothetical protein